MTYIFKGNFIALWRRVLRLATMARLHQHQNLYHHVSLSSLILNLNILEKWVLGSWEEAKIDRHFTVRKDSGFIVFSLRGVEIWHVHVTHSLHEMAAHFSIYIY